VNGFWLVEELAELVDGPTGCGKVVRESVFICLELQRDKVNCTPQGEDKRTTPHMMLLLP